MRNIPLTVLFLLLLNSGASAQITVSDDAYSVETILRDSLIIDSLAAETEAKSELDTIVFYSGNDVTFLFNPRRTLLKGKANVKYQETILDADEILIDWDQDLLTAKGRIDTLLTDSTGMGEDSVRWIGLPALDDGTQLINGQEMTYNIKTRRGRVLKGDTEFGDGYYHGKIIKMIQKNEYNIGSGKYSTCDAEEPHYHFWAKDMKLLVKDKVAARPIVLCFDGTPVLIAPFAVFSARGGRHSGIIIPTYGESSGQGRYFRNLGYYWAPNDYFDVKGSLDFYERYGILFGSSLNYVKRYLFNGSVKGSIINQTRDNRVVRRWDLSVNHSHTFSPTLSLMASGRFVSDDSYLQDVSQNQREMIERIIRSNATLSKSWPETPYRANVNVNYEKNLTTKAVSQSLPRLNFSRSRSRIIPLPEGAKNDDERFWNKFYYGYSMKGEIRKRVSYREFMQNTDDDTISYELKDSRVRGGIHHNLSLNFTPEPVLFVSITPGFKYSEVWYDEYYSYQMGNDGLVDTTKHSGVPDGFKSIRTFSSNVSFSTKLYGLFNADLLTLKAIRHTISPSIGLSYRPDFSEPKWGYYDIFTDASGKERKYDRFHGGIYGSASKSESRSVSLSLGNLFEYKRMVKEKETKGQIVGLNSSTSYNFAADSLKWSNLTTSITFPTLGAVKEPNRFITNFSGLAIRGSASHSFYSLNENDAGNLTVVDKSAENLLRLLSINLTSSFSISGDVYGKSVNEDKEISEKERDSDLFEQSTTYQTDYRQSTEWQPGSLPWLVSLSFRYSERHDNPDEVKTTIWGSMKLELDVTKNWELNYNTDFDMHNRKIVSNSIAINRDMHCWEGRLSWYPSGLSKGFYLKINVKSAQLQDIKVERRKGGGGFLGY